MKVSSKMTTLAAALLTSALAANLTLKGPCVRADGPAGLPRFVPTPEQLRKGYLQSRRFNRQRPQVYKGQIKANWYHDNNRFWYRNDLRGGDKEFVVVDAERGVRQPAFDHGNLAAALWKAAGKRYAATRLPFDSLEFVDSDKAIRFKVDQTTWQCNLATYACTPAQQKTTYSPPPAESGDDATLATPQDDELLPHALILDEGAAPAQQNRPGHGRPEPPPSPRSSERRKKKR